MITKLFDTLEQLNDTYLSVWEETCNLESPTTDKQGVDAVGNYYAKRAEARGWTVERFLHPIAGNVVCITMNPNAKLPLLTLSGHMDTVHAVGSFGTPAVKRDAEKIYGPGVTDCKGGIVAAFFAMDALERCGFRNRPIRLILQSDEEGGGKQSNDATIQYMCERAEGSVAFLNLEPSAAGRACIERKGIATFTLIVHGIEAHSSTCAKHGASAILEAAHKIIELEKLKDHAGITCSCTVISGGTTHNTVAGRCEFKANVRFATAAQLEEAKAYVQRVADTVYVEDCSCEVILPRVRPAMERDEKNTALLNRLNEVWTANGLPALAPKVGLGGSDASNVSAYGIPCIDSLGTSGGEIHSLKEYGNLSSLLESAKRIAVAALYL